MELRGVPERGNVEIHIGNFPSNSLGCVLVGTTFGPNRVDHSHLAYAKLKAAFYGSATPSASPMLQISITFEGAVSAPPGDFVRGGNQSA